MKFKMIAATAKLRKHLHFHRVQSSIWAYVTIILGQVTLHRHLHHQEKPYDPTLAIVLLTPYISLNRLISNSKDSHNLPGSSIPNHNNVPTVLNLFEEKLSFFFLIRTRSSTIVKSFLFPLFMKIYKQLEVSKWEPNDLFFKLLGIFGFKPPWCVCHLNILLHELSYTVSFLCLLSSLNHEGFVQLV